MMSGPTWLPPKQVGVSGSPGILVSAPVACKPQKSFATAPTAPRPVYGSQEANGTMSAMGPAPRYPPPAAGPPSLPQDATAEPRYLAKEDRGSGGSWGSVSPPGYHGQGPSPDQRPACSSSIDVQIDSLTNMLADMESAGHRRGERQNVDSAPYPSAPPQPGASKPTGAYKPGPSGAFPPGKPAAFATDSYAKSVPYGGPPSQAPIYPASSGLPSQYGALVSSDSYGAGYHRATAVPKPFPQPTPASYATASTSPSPHFNIQVKVAQPVLGYNQPRRRAEQAYGPPSPRPGYGAKLPPQYASEPGLRVRPHEADPWYPEPPSYGKRAGEGEFYAAPGGHAKLGSPGGQYQSGLVKPGKEELAAVSQMPAGGGGLRYQHQAPPSRPEEELDRLTKKLVYDMNNPPSGEYFGRCARCGENVVGDGTGCVAMDQVFHVECFTCSTCHCRLRGQPFYAIDRRSYCESCYIVTLEKCSMCSKAIMDRILRAMGKAYHPQCFTCVVCHRCLDGVPFTVDATSQIHCIEDFHRKFAPRCSVCGNAIMPEPGQEETVRIVALDRSFHIGCYKCEVRALRDLAALLIYKESSCDPQADQSGSEAKPLPPRRPRQSPIPGLRVQTFTPPSSPKA
ncbi:PREDICTED: thyroid receptor-interacting protein 6-like [Gekko japonicus]|uniref:Thyroid receptor-interacting protein 6-like n=1 Tax=Gekko japonicus TaxID=146911 RepID=A0ABM1KBV3_GEKJA|nr:PREDICTED: thyroid receptor-interacting protein 6-like [Gekko japonicus]